MGSLLLYTFQDLRSILRYVKTMTETAGRLLDQILRMRNCQVCGYFFCSPKTLLLNSTAALLNVHFTAYVVTIQVNVYGNLRYISLLTHDRKIFQ